MKKENATIILGISAFYHDSAAALLINGKIISAAQEERFTRKKHDPSFPVHAIQFCLQESKLELADIDQIVFYDKPFLKFERLLETYYHFAPRGILSFFKAIPVWLKEKLFLKRLLKTGFKEIQSDFTFKKGQLLFPEHHLSHAASAFYPSPFEKAAILTIDGVGEWATASLAIGEGSNIKVLKELSFPHSVGLLYSSFTYFLGFKVNSGEYKLMGLAPYGNAKSEQTQSFIKTIKEDLIEVFEDGSIRLNLDYFKYTYGLRMVDDKKWEQCFGFPKRAAESPLESHHTNLGLAIQIVTEEIVLKMAAHLAKETGCKNLCMAGGVALNCVANGKIEAAGIFDEIFIQPAAGDAGGALGAAQAAHYIHLGNSREINEEDSMKGSYLGPEYEDLDVALMIRQLGAKGKHFKDFTELTQLTAKKIAEGLAIGWFQGKMEFGPRALGHRSILGDPRNEETQKTLNLKIKYRESFRPFAPAILEDKVQDYFDTKAVSPYMLMVHPVHKDHLSHLPEGYQSLPMEKKLYTKRSTLPAITHVDSSARIQTVNPKRNPKFHAIIDAFFQETGCPILVNTSFNVRGEPIVCTPEDAYRCFMRTEMDILVIGNYYFDKKEQAAWTEEENWQDTYELD